MTVPLLVTWLTSYVMYISTNTSHICLPNIWHIGQFGGNIYFWHMYGKNMWSGCWRWSCFCIYIYQYSVHKAIQNDCSFSYICNLVAIFVERYIPITWDVFCKIFVQCSWSLSWCQWLHMWYICIHTSLSKICWHNCFWLTHNAPFYKWSWKKENML